MENNYCYVLSSEASDDLEHLYEDGILRWGANQADAYFDSLLLHFDLLCDNPLLFQAVNEIRKGYRRSVCGKHSIYYRIKDNILEIMAIVRYQDRYGV